MQTPVHNDNAGGSANDLKKNSPENGIKLPHRDSGAADLINPCFYIQEILVFYIQEVLAFNTDNPY